MIWATEVHRPTVVYDACVLYPAPLRDLLMHVALADLCRAKWTDAIHEEWTRNLLMNRPDLQLAQLQRTRDLMNAHVRDCMVTGYESLISTLVLPDPYDRHVLAAAIHCRAGLIITFNLRDFPEAALRAYGVEARHPDRFLMDLLIAAPELFYAAARLHRSTLKHPPKTVDEYLQTLTAQGLTQTVEGLRRSLHSL